MVDMKKKLEEFAPKAKSALTYKWRGNLHDQWIDFKYWALIWKASFEMMQTYEGRKLTKEEKQKLSDAMFKYPWMFDAMKYNNMVNKASIGRHGAVLESFKLVILYATRSAIPAIQNMVLCPEETVFCHSMIPNELFQAMDIKVCRMEQAANSLCLADQHAEEPYLNRTRMMLICIDYLIYQHYSAVLSKVQIGKRKKGELCGSPFPHLLFICFPIQACF